jgi:DHA1 family bicyclomycin/chloramphenicol resistance-like MFS transporter
MSGPTLWTRPRWQLALMLAGLSTLGPFSIDTYLPAFTGIAASIGATALGMQQTLSAYLFGFAFMMLFHGALSDALGRKPVIVAGLTLFTLASFGAALSTSLGSLIVFRALQGMSAGAGMIVGRAIIRDLYEDADAQRMMSLSTIFFGVAPAIAPLIGGYLYTHLDWPSIFLFLALIGLLLWLMVVLLLPETLAREARQPFEARALFAGYKEVGLDSRFLLLSFASGVPFNGFFLYVLSAPVFLGELHGMDPREFWQFFLTPISGIVLGSALSGRLAGRIPAALQVRLGYIVMAVAMLVNLVCNALAVPSRIAAFAPLFVYTFGWALVVPSVTLAVLNLFPARRGMAASLQGFVGSATNGVVAGVVAPLVMHSRMGLAMAAACMLGVGASAWLLFKRRWAAPGETLPR